VTDRLAAAVAELVAAIREEVAVSRPTEAPTRLLSVAEAASALGIGRSRLYEEIGKGRVRTVRSGRRRLVPADAIDAFVEQAS
jgi:excisionase family DNA binding protein